MSLSSAHVRHPNFLSSCQFSSVEPIEFLSNNSNLGASHVEQQYRTLAQAFVNQAEALVDSSTLKLALRAILGTGMTGDEITKLVKDVHEINTEPIESEAVGGAPQPLLAVTNTTPDTTDVCAKKIAALELKEDTASVQFGSQLTAADAGNVSRLRSRPI